METEVKQVGDGKKYKGGQAFYGDPGYMPKSRTRGLRRQWERMERQGNKAAADGQRSLVG
jgi:hypothetical protein